MDIFHKKICSFFYILSYLYGFKSFVITLFYQFSVRHHLQSDIRDVPDVPSPTPLGLMFGGKIVKIRKLRNINTKMHTL